MFCTEACLNEHGLHVICLHVTSMLPSMHAASDLVISKLQDIEQTACMRPGLQNLDGTQLVLQTVLLGCSDSGEKVQLHLVSCAPQSEVSSGNQSLV